jgi:hypothetical protein
MDSQILLVADNFVYAPTFTLRADLHETYTYPMDGWYWFDTEEEAHNALDPVPSPPTVYELLLVGTVTEDSKLEAKADLAIKLGLSIEQIDTLLSILTTP